MLDLNSAVLFIKLYFVELGDKLMQYITDSLNNPEADRILEQELKELEEAHSESINSYCTQEELDLIIIDSMRFKGF